jgi:hypothetical protein
MGTIAPPHGSLAEHQRDTNTLPERRWSFGPERGSSSPPINDYFLMNDIFYRAACVIFATLAPFFSTATVCLEFPVSLSRIYNKRRGKLLFYNMGSGDLS